jgi:hypothetical protein
MLLLALAMLAAWGARRLGVEPARGDARQAEVRA